MKNFIDVKVRWNKTMSDGLVKRVSENYLIDAMSFTEAENRMIDEFIDYENVDATVSAVRKSNICELIESGDSGEKSYFKAKVWMIAIDEKNGKEKLQPFYMLIHSESIDMALETTNKHLKDSMCDCRVASISETPILEVFENE